jgi:hypothetical protein
MSNAKDKILELDNQDVVVQDTSEIQEVEVNDSTVLSVEKMNKELKNLHELNPEANTYKPIEKNNHCRFKVEKSKLPEFTGDIRVYFIFKEDFKQFVEPQFPEREAVTILRGSLKGKPFELIGGLGQDY